MKKIYLIAAAMLLTGSIATYAEDAAGKTEKPKAAVEKAEKKTPEQMMAEVDKALTERKADLAKATQKGNTELANAIQKLVNDLNNMKSALQKNDMEAFKSADQQRKTDKAALDALHKAKKEQKDTKDQKHK